MLLSGKENERLCKTLKLGMGTLNTFRTDLNLSLGKKKIIFSIFSNFFFISETPIMDILDFLCYIFLIFSANCVLSSPFIYIASLSLFIYFSLCNIPMFIFHLCPDVQPALSHFLITLSLDLFISSLRFLNNYRLLSVIFDTMRNYLPEPSSLIFE